MQRGALFVSGARACQPHLRKPDFLRPECVSAGILMLTYLSTLRLKIAVFLVRPKNAYFANSPTPPIAFALLWRV